MASKSPSKGLKINGREALGNGNSNASSGSSTPELKRSKKRSRKKEVRKLPVNKDAIDMITDDRVEDRRGNGEEQKLEVSLDGGRELASPEAGPSRIPIRSAIPPTSVPGTPESTFVPLRSILTGIGRLSPSPSRSPLSPVLDNGVDIVVDEIPDPRQTSKPPDSLCDGISHQHFDPPGLFSTTLTSTATSDPTVKSPNGKDKDKAAPGPSEPSVPLELLLPAHIQLDDHPKTVDDVEDRHEDVSMEGLHFVDDDKTRGVTRYFDPTEPTAEATFLATADQSRICPNCKRPGHKSWNCPHIICTVCGAEDEHERRDCPHSLVCFGCGQRGHRQNDCPDPVSRASRKRGCDRCGSRDHPETSCPTHWRVYAYWSTAERQQVQKGKRKAEGWAKEAVGGLETEEWCYNCSNSGHLGDDCPRPRVSGAKLFFPSAFSYTMASRGPFHVPTPTSRILSTPTHARWDDDEELSFVKPGFGGANAGKKSRDKARRAMMDLEEGEVSDDEEEDWFNGTGERGSTFVRGNQNGRNKPWNSDNRPKHKNRGNGDRNGDRSALPFSHSQLTASAPAASKGKTLSFGKITTPGRSDSPTAKRGKAKKGDSSNNLLARALQNSTRDRDKESGIDSPISTSKGGSRSTKKKKRKAEKEDETDWESRWWDSGVAGGKVMGWGKGMDSGGAPGGSRGVGEGKVGEGKKKGASGQRYTGGY